MNLPKTAKRINNSKDYIDIDGSVYTERTNYHGKPSGHWIRKSQHIVHGYKYCGIYSSEQHKCVQKRVHKLVAEAFIPNPNGLPIVGHKNNIKTDNRVENLYWTTYQENIQKAVDDGLLVNAKGYDDSQSKPVIMFDTYTNAEIARFPSICEAVKHTGLSKTTIARQARYHRPVRKPYYFRYQDDATTIIPVIIGMFDFDTDKLIQTFINTSDASRKTNICEKTIAQQCKNGKPKHKFSNQYFKYLNSKCESTIEHTYSK